MSVESWMSRFGWTDGGGPGSVKMDTNNVQVAVYGDRRWQSDLDYAGYRAAMQKANADLIDDIEVSLTNCERREGEDG